MAHPMRALYRFHKELNRPFASTEALVAHALSLISKQVTVDRLSAFLLDPEDATLRLALCLAGEMRQELDEEIHLLESSPLWRLVEGRGEALAFSAPHPILYLPLRDAGSPMARGVLRLERNHRPERGRGGSDRAFTAPERKAAARLAIEMCQNLRQAELAARGRSQLKRMEALTDLTAVFATSLRVEDGLRLILQGIQSHFALDRVRLFLVDRSAKTLRGELSVDVRREVRSLRDAELPMTPGTHRFVDLVLSGGKEPVPEHYRQTLHLPLTVQGEGTGLLILDNLLSQEPIEPEDAALLKSFAGQIALAVDNARLFDEVQALSLHDSLTGLPLRRYFNQRAQEEVYRAQRSGTRLALGVMDIDYFKGINDTYGHQIGDLVLQEAGRLLLASLRKIDFPCRYGGDEIVLLLPQAGEEEALRTLARLAEELRGLRVPVPFSKAGEVRITVSVGLAVYPDDAASLEELVQKADEALYWVKSRGRDGVAAYARVRRAGAEGSPAA